MANEDITKWYTNSNSQHFFPPVFYRITYSIYILRNQVNTVWYLLEMLEVVENNIQCIQIQYLNIFQTN